MPDDEQVGASFVVKKVGGGVGEDGAQADERKDVEATESYGAGFLNDWGIDGDDVGDGVGILF